MSDPDCYTLAHFGSIRWSLLCSAASVALFLMEEVAGTQTLERKRIWTVSSLLIPLILSCSFTKRG